MASTNVMDKTQCDVLIVYLAVSGFFVLCAADLLALANCACRHCSVPFSATSFFQSDWYICKMKASNVLCHTALSLQQ